MISLRSALKKYWLWILIGIPLAFMAVFVIWAETAPGPMPEARAAMQSDGLVSVDTQRWLVFQPAGAPPKVGFIFYPGGRVNPQSYAPALRVIAAMGYLAVIVPAPLNLSVFAPDAAEAVIAAYPQIGAWAVGGHSLGGAMAAQYAYTHPTRVRGLVLWAAYPPGNADLSTSDLTVISIFGSRDGLATGPKIDASRALLPANTAYVSITGGNHAQFGWYGPQAGDNPADLSRADQQAQIVAATVELLQHFTRVP